MKTESEICDRLNGTTFSIEEIEKYLESQLELQNNLSNRRLELAIREICDPFYGIAAITASSGESH